MERALHEIVRRHEVLRTVFANVDGVAVQIVSPRGTISLRRHDLRGGSEPDRRARAEAMASDEARASFDLAKGPLLRAQLLRLDEEEHVLVVTIHHIISDGWSIGIITQELGTLYDACCRGVASPSPLESLPLQFGDFAIWQEEWLKSNSKDLEDQIAFWTRRLAGMTPVAMPTDRPRQPVQTFRGMIDSILLPRELTNRLASLALQEQATPFMVMLAAFQILLQRHSGQDDLFVSSVVAGRSRVELEPLIGLFINPLVLRTNLSGQPSFLELLGRVRQTVLEAFAHQDVPFERVVEALKIRRQRKQPAPVPRQFPVPARFCAAVRGIGAETDRHSVGVAWFHLRSEFLPGRPGRRAAGVLRVQYRFV